MIYNVKSRLTNIYWIRSKPNAVLEDMGVLVRGDV